MTSTEITNGENVSVDGGSSYPTYPSSFYPTKPGAYPLDQLGFLFIFCPITLNELISNLIIIIHIFYLYLLAMVYVSPILYILDWENPVLYKNQLACTLILNYMIHGSYLKGC